jgi:hypothetical protein
MGTTATRKMIESFVESCARGRPVPLKSTAYEIDVLSGVAIVKQKRVFRNDEAVPIEAVMTFPVAFEGVVTRLEAVVAGRRLRGVASPKLKARATYEAAVDAGKAAVLHEELMRGIHMVSVANVAPGVEIAVEATFVMPVSLVGGHASLRIPQTVGEVYGRLPLQDSDQLTTGGPGGEADVKVSATSGVVYLNGRTSQTDRAKIGLDDQIVVRVEGMALAPISGRAADGRDVTLSFFPYETRDVALDFDLMVDVSGSMRELVGKAQEGDSRWNAFKHGVRSAIVGRASEMETKWDALKRGVKKAAASFERHDTARLWAFGDECVLWGSYAASALPEALDGMDGPRGGTYLVEAVNKVVVTRPEANVLLITDGKSATGTELDIESIVATGARVTVVLIGGDALEARVGHLAAQSGGQMFVAHGTDASAAVAAAIAAMRGVALPAARLSLPLLQSSRTAGGLKVVADWRDQTEYAAPLEHVGAYAASLALTGLDSDTAATLAASEGLVSHLTSLVLVDEEGAVVDQLPEQRKVSLPSYGKGVMRSMAMVQSVDRINAADLNVQGAGEMHVVHKEHMVRVSSFHSDPSGVQALVGAAPGGAKYGVKPWPERQRHAGSDGARWPIPGGAADVPYEIPETSSIRPWVVDPVVPEISLPRHPVEILSDGAEQHGYDWWIGGSRRFLENLAWENHVNGLTGKSPDFEGVPLAAVAVFMRVSSVSWIVEAANSAGIDPKSLSVGLLAALFAGENRAAARISRRLLKGVPEAVVESLKAKLGASI